MVKLGRWGERDEQASPVSQVQGRFSPYLAAVMAKSNIVENLGSSYVVSCFFSGLLDISQNFFEIKISWSPCCTD